MQADLNRRHFSAPLADTDPLVADILAREAARQAGQIELIASENIVSRAVLEALGALITNKTLEGYPGRRYHGGGYVVDEVENLAIERAKTLFGCQYANVQPHSGSQANQAVFVALLRPGDTVLSMDLAAGGHLSHGAAPNLSGKWFDVVSYGVEADTGLLDYAELERLAFERGPKLIIAGGSAYSRTIDFARIRAVADQVGATFLVDMAHFVGLVAGAVFPSPVPHAHITSCTTTKTLRGPRGGVLLTDDPKLAKRIDSAVFPGTQGSLHPNVIAAKAVCLGEALEPAFRAYAAQVVENARALAETLAARSLGVIAGGTDTHIVLADVSPCGLTGDRAEKALEAAHITSNKNPAPGDPSDPARWRGVRLGTAAATTRGLDAEDFRQVGGMIADVWQSAGKSEEPDPDLLESVRGQVAAICECYPVYGG